MTKKQWDDEIVECSTNPRYALTFENFTKCCCLHARLEATEMICISQCIVGGSCSFRVHPPNSRLFAVNPLFEFKILYFARNVEGPRQFWRVMAPLVSRKIATEKRT